MNRNHWLILSGLFALFVILRLQAAWVAGSLWFDEAFSVHFASMPLGEMLQFLRFEHNPLAHFLSLHAWMNVFGSSEFAARMLSVFAGILSFWGLYALGKKLLGKTASLWALFFFTVSSLQLYHQTEARMYAFVGLFTIASVYFFWRWYETRRRSLLLGFLFSSILLVHTHITAWAVPVALFLFWITSGQKKERKDWISLLSVYAVAALAFLLWFIPVMQNKLLAGNVSQGWFFFQQNGGYFIEHLANFLVIGETSLLIRSFAAFLIAVLLILSFLKIEKPGWWQRIKSLFDHSHWPVRVVFETDTRTKLLLFLFFTPLALGLIFQITVTKYLFASGIALCLLLAKGMMRLNDKRLQTIFAACLILVALPMTLRLLFVQRHHWDEVAKQVEAVVREKDDAMVLTHSFVWKLPLERYLSGNIEVTSFYPFEDDLTFDERVVRYNWQALVNRDNVRELRETLGDTQTIILVSSTPNEDERDPVKNWFWQNGYMLKGKLNWSGYGDPEVLILERTNQ